MIVLDANLLIYASIRELPQHKAAIGWLDQQLVSTPRVGLPWSSLVSYLRVVTNARVFRSPVPIRAAWKQVEDWLAEDCVWIPLPTDRHSSIFGRLVTTVAGQSALVPDAHLAALAIEHGLTLCSSDGDFARFPDLRWINPLAAS